MREKFVDQLMYQSMVGILIFLTHSRPYISFAVSCVIEYLGAPRQNHFIPAKRILRCIKGTTFYGIFYPHASTIELISYTNSDWGRDLDKRRSTSSMVFKLGPAPIHWSSKLQPTIAMSTTKTKYQTLAEGAKEIVWLHNLLVDMHILQEGPTMLFCDNQSSIIKTCEEPCLSCKNKKH